MSGKWTPGPWEANSVLLLVQPPKTEFRITDREFRSVAIVRCDHRRSDAETSAIARLIAQSPELADVLEAMVERFGHDIFTMPPEDRDLLTRAADVLAKAKGEGA